MKSIVFILILAAFLRFYHLGSVPPSPSLDEVSIGYNAYSILKTGADEYGTKFPLLLRAYDDWRPALYVYFTIPFVWVLGLTATAVRLPSAIFSIITVYVTYLLIKEVFKKNKFSLAIPEVASLLLAISPWHIYLSRLGHEVNLGLSFVIIGVFLFVKAVHAQKSLFLFPCSSFFFGLALYTYQSQKIIVPILVLTLLLIYWKDLLLKKKELFFAGIIGLALLIPAIYISLSPEALIRLQGTSAFINNPLYIESSLRLLKAHQEKDLLGIVLNNRRMVTASIFFTNYISHFNPYWLFWGTTRESHKVPWLGLLYPWEAPLIVLGIVSLFKKIPLKTNILLFVWFFSAPIPAAFTTQAPHAMRSFTFLPIWQILSASGFFFLLHKLKQKILIATALIIVAFSTIYLYIQYFTVFPMTQSDSFQYALGQAMKYVTAHQDEYEKIVFSDVFYNNERSPYQSYMFFLFSSRYDPMTYQLQGGTVSGGYNQTHQFGKFEFRPIQWESEKRNAATLYVGNIGDFLSNMETLFIANNLDRSPAVVIAK